MSNTWSITHGLNELDDKRIAQIRPLIPPQILMEDLPVSELAEKTVKQGRIDVERIVHRQDDRLLVVVGPCSIHDPKAAIEYGKSLSNMNKCRKILIEFNIHILSQQTQSVC
jgi:3-deoxy-7-phosphoheptulonate synthase